MKPKATRFHIKPVGMVQDSNLKKEHLVVLTREKTTETSIHI